MAQTARNQFTRAERQALVNEVDRLYRAGGRTYVSIARELGIGDSSYHSWLAAGIKPRQQPLAAATRVLYSPQQRADIVAEVERRVAAGETCQIACLALGIQGKTFRTWRQKLSLPLREVAITALVPAFAAPPTPLAGTSLTVVAPNGYRVEGLDLESVARLLRALAC
jgi:transposase-like protein